MIDNNTSKPLPVVQGDELNARDAESEVATKGAEDGPRERVPLWVQIIWVLLAAFGFIDSLFASPGSFLPLRPNASALALAWLVVGIVGLIINGLDSVGLPGGASFSFRKLQRVEKAAAKSEVSVEALREVLLEYSGLMQNWAQSVNLFAEQLKKYAETEEDVPDILARFCLGRMEEAKEVIAERGDRTRLSFWWFVDDENGLKMLFSDDIRDEATLNHVFKPGAGLLGQCYVEDRIYNLEDAPASIYYEQIRPNPDYHGLLLIPVKVQTDAAVIGILSIDRQKKKRSMRTLLMSETRWATSLRTPWLRLQHLVPRGDASHLMLKKPSRFCRRFLGFLKKRPGVIFRHLCWIEAPVRGNSAGRLAQALDGGGVSSQHACH